MKITQFIAIKQTKTYAGIVEQITRLIQDGHLSPGDKLPAERTLAKELGTGRQCLREALSVMEAMGILEVKHGRGTFITADAAVNVLKLSADADDLVNPFELLETRKIVEVKAVGLAAKRANEEDIAVLEHLIAELKYALDSGTNSMESDRKLHLALVKASHNSVLYNIMHDITGRMERKVWEAVKAKSLTVPGRMQKYHDEHTAIVQAVKQGDVRQAEQIMHKHLVNIEKDLLSM